MTRLTPDERDLARQRVGTATTSIAILAVGAVGAASILAWHATAEASAATSSGTKVGAPLPRGDEREDREHDDGPGGGWSGVSGGVQLPPGGIQAAPPPGQGAGSRGVVGSQGS